MNALALLTVFRRVLIAILILLSVVRDDGHFVKFFLVS